MRYLIASDIHGSSQYTDQLLSAMDIEGADMLVLLGDIYNHGPRNPLPEGYAPMEVAEKLNRIKDKLLVIKGNCDSEVDQMISQFHFAEEGLLVSGGTKVYLTHGHKYNKDNLPAISKGDCLIYGHFHTVLNTESKGVICLNPGSVSLPKDGNRAYILLDEGKYRIRLLSGATLIRGELRKNIE